MKDHLSSAAASRRDRALRRLHRVRLAATAFAVVATGLFVQVAADAFPGHASATRATARDPHPIVRRARRQPITAGTATRRAATPRIAPRSHRLVRPAAAPPAAAPQAPAPAATSTAPATATTPAVPSPVVSGGS